MTPPTAIKVDYFCLSKSLCTSVIVIRKARKKFIDVSFIILTSNVHEPLFSKARNALS